MIVQSAPQGQAHFVITQTDHARMSGQLARAWGNAQFAPLRPREPMEFVTAHHDEGWPVVDDAFLLDARTNLPYHLTQTPLPELIKTGVGSPVFNEAHHPYSGLISSMHTWGLYNGRYGLSDKIFINSIPADYRPQVDALLNGEIARQERLKQQLNAPESDMAAWCAPAHLFHNYKLLQFFDTLALYFHTTHEAVRAPAQFLNVPQDVDNDITISVHPISTGIYSVKPYPFAEKRLEIFVEGRYLHPLKPGESLADVLRDTPKTRQTYTLVAG